ncbi:MAG: hypothetical protein NC124_08995 [Clostridium sp.]|nr:hypothetical protein [Clostridium sp.]
MKLTDKKKPVETMPKGVWESERPDKGKAKNSPLSETTDLQGNGYPDGKQCKDAEIS